MLILLQILPEHRSFTDDVFIDENELLILSLDSPEGASLPYPIGYQLNQEGGRQHPMNDNPREALLQCKIFIVVHLRKLSGRSGPHHQLSRCGVLHESRQGISYGYIFVIDL